ncbi:MAG: oxidoreductase [Streptosporangiales bacterium]|nr:oxidoreductase [Streptosporangiales bacterium]
MARAAVLGRVSWRVGTVTTLRDETPTARTLVLQVSDWPGHAAGQHVDVRLTAADGYSATRSYSIASAADGERVEITVERLPDGEVSPYLTREAAVGDPLELLGPLGGWFVWRPGQPEPVQLVAGGSGLVPLMAMVRARERSGSGAPMRLLYSVRDPTAVLYRDELRRRAQQDRGLEVAYAYTRAAPEGWSRRPGRVDGLLLAEATWAPDRAPTCYVCGPTGFVEAVADLLLAAGHDPGRIRTERFGPTGGPR